MWTRQKAEKKVIDAVYKYILKRGTRGAYTNRICNALSFTFNEIYDALAELRESQIIHATNERWWVRNRK